MSAHPAEDIATAVPQEYALGNREVYVRALVASQAIARWTFRSRRGRDRL
jgi:hypothetical protein